MATFRFRLQKVLEYREMVEGWAKDAYLEARGARLHAQNVLERMQQKRVELNQGPAESLDARLTLQNCLEALAEEERQQRIVIQMLEDDEEQRRAEWTEKRKELQILEKLRDAALEEWELEQRRKEQKEMDEFAVLRSAA
jgi:flagellar protein FliJ